MADFGVTPEGFVIKPLEIIRQEVDDFQRQNIDAGLDLSDQSVLGQINGTQSAQIATVWELGQAVYSSQYPDSASDASLTSVSSITGTIRSGASKTIVRSVEVTLNPSTPLPIGSVANIENQPSARFVTLTALPGSATGGIFLVDFEAEDTGTIEVPINSLIQIAEPVPGWTGVDNTTTSGETGSETETDDNLRIKREIELTAQGSTSVDAVRADVSRLDGIVAVNVFENVDDVFDSQGLRPHSIRVITRGGTSQEIADQIFKSKAAGINTNGTTVSVVTDSQGFNHTIRHDEGTPEDFFADLEIEVDTQTFDGVQGVIDIKAAIAVYVNGLNLGQTVIYDQVKCEALAITGVVKFGDVFIDFSAFPTGEVDLPVDEDQFAESDVANINVVVL